MKPSLGKRIRQGLRDHLGPGLAVGLLRLYNKLLRVDYLGWEKVAARRESGPVILCHWHGDDLALLVPFASRRLTMMVSRSRDGDLLSAIMARLGYSTVRGSTSRGGGQALRQMVRALRAGRDMGLTVDGPRGPREVVKPGVITLARLSGAPIFPAGVWADRKWVFKKTWHRTYLPKPGARIRFAFGEPILVPADATRERMEELRKEVEAEFFRLHDLARQGDGPRSEQDKDLRRKPGDETR